MLLCQGSATLLLGCRFLIGMLRLPYAEFGVVDFIVKPENVLSCEVVASQMKPVSLFFVILRLVFESCDLSG